MFFCLISNFLLSSYVLSYVYRNYEIDDISVRTFAINFYTCLLHKNLSVKESFNIAKDINNSSHPEETHKYLLLPENGDHDKKLSLPPIESVTTGLLIDESPKKNIISNLLKTENIIIGRDRMILGCYRMIHRLKFEKCIVLVGDSKIGKTAVSNRGP